MLRGAFDAESDASFWRQELTGHHGARDDVASRPREAPETRLGVRTLPGRGTVTSSNHRSHERMARQGLIVSPATFVVPALPNLAIRRFCSTETTHDPRHRRSMTCSAAARRPRAPSAHDHAVLTALVELPDLMTAWPQDGPIGHSAGSRHGGVSSFRRQRSSLRARRTRARGGAADGPAAQEQLRPKDV